MDRVITILFLLLFAQQGLSQSLNTDLKGRWEDQNLPLFAGLRYNDIWGYVSSDQREYAILGSLDYVHFIDVTDPTTPTEVDREFAGDNCVWRDFKTYQNYAYSIGEFCNTGLKIYDLSTLPDSVKTVYDSNEFFTNAHNVWIDSLTGRLYAVGVTSGAADVVVLDIASDPKSPVLLKNLLFPDYGYVHDIHVINDTAYVSHAMAERLVIYDFTTLPGDPVPISEIGSNGFNHSSWLTEDKQTIIIADESYDAPLLISDVSDIETPVVRSSIKSTLLAPSGSIAHNPFVVGEDFVAVAYYDDGLQIIKIDSLDQPFIAGYYDTDTLTTSYSSMGAWGAFPYLPSGNILVVDIVYGMYVIDPLFPLKDCLEEVMVGGIYDRHWDIIAKDQISTTASYKDQAELAMKAPLMIQLNTGFSIEQGSVMDAIITDDCDSARPGKPTFRLKGN